MKAVFLKGYGFGVMEEETRAVERSLQDHDLVFFCELISTLNGCRPDVYSLRVMRNPNSSDMLDEVFCRLGLNRLSDRRNDEPIEFTGGAGSDKKVDELYRSLLALGITINTIDIEYED